MVHALGLTGSLAAGNWQGSGCQGRKGGTGSGIIHARWPARTFPHLSFPFTLIAIISLRAFVRVDNSSTIQALVVVNGAEQNLPDHQVTHPT